jgi:hypothetical protein
MLTLTLGYSTNVDPDLKILVLTSWFCWSHHQRSGQQQHWIFFFCSKEVLILI